MTNSVSLPCPVRAGVAVGKAASRRLLLGILSGLWLLALLAAARADPSPKTVRDFGAVGNGKTDDTLAIQRAIDAKTGDILFPRGVYLITRPLVVDLDAVGRE